MWSSTISAERTRASSRPLPLWGFGVLVHAIMLVLFLGLPGDPLRNLLPQIAGPIIVLYPLAVLLIGRILVEQENRYLTTIAAGGGAEITHFLAENTVDSIWLMDMDLTFRYVNPAVERMFGFTMDEWLGTRLSDHATPKAMASMSGLIEKTVRNLPDNNYVLFETEILRKDGTALPVEIASRMLLADDGRPIGLYGSTQDITDRKRAEAEQRNARASLEQLVEASDAKSRFLRSMSHELRTPLNSIIGFSDILAKGMAGEMNEEQHRQADMINHSGHHLLGLINDILDLSRIEADRLDLEFAEFDIADLAGKTVESLAAEAEAKGIELTFEAPEAPERIVSDQRKVSQILLNLLGNAIKFTDTGAVKVQLHGPARGFISLDVVDTGPGIGPEDQGRVFEEFVQSGRLEEASRSGTGLGLAIARGLARALGGTVTLSSSLGDGSTFTLLLPRTPSMADEASTSPPHPMS